MDALTAHDARAVDQVFTQGRDYHGMIAAAFNAQGVYSLDYGTGFDATAAQYAFVRVPEQGMGRNVFGKSSNFVFKRVVTDDVFCCQAL
jgi:hypothetical protein